MRGRAVPAPFCGVSRIHYVFMLALSCRPKHKAEMRNVNYTRFVCLLIVGGTLAADFQITLTGHITLTVDDFLL